jgi:hypothetical protein
MTTHKENTPTAGVMTKSMARELVHTRAHGTMRSGPHSVKDGQKYTKAECDVLVTLIDGTDAGGANWREFDIEQGRCSLTPARIARKTHLRESTVYAALTRLEKDGLIKVYRGVESEAKDGRPQYTVTCQNLKQFQPTPVKSIRTIWRENKRKQRVKVKAEILEPTEIKVPQETL